MVLDWKLLSCLPSALGWWDRNLAPRKVFCLRPQTSLLSYLEGREVHSLEMLQSLTEGDQLPRLICARLAPCGKREDTLRFIMVVILSVNIYRGRAFWLSPLSQTMAFSGRHQISTAKISPLVRGWHSLLGQVPS